VNKINYEALDIFIASDVMEPFYSSKLKLLQSLSLAKVLKRKNPYLLKARNIETPENLAKFILSSFLSLQEETIFGSFMEKLVIHCSQIFSGYKAEKGKYRGIDLIFERDSRDICS